MAGLSRKRKRSIYGGQQKKKSNRREDSEPIAADTEVEAEGDTFQVETILASKKDRGKVKYRVRWKGYGPSDDTWEPLENVASTGHVDRFIRKERAKHLNKNMPGIAVIQYEDGEEEMVDMKKEKFKECSESENADGDVGEREIYGQDFNLLSEGAMIRIMWHHADLGFDCKIISWVPLDDCNFGASDSIKAVESEVIAKTEKKSHRTTTREEGNEKSKTKKVPDTIEELDRISSNLASKGENMVQNPQVDVGKEAKYLISKNHIETVLPPSKPAKPKKSDSSSSLTSKSTSNANAKFTKRNNSSVILLKSNPTKQSDFAKKPPKIDSLKRPAKSNDNDLPQLKTDKFVESSDDDAISSIFSEESLHWSEKPVKRSGFGIPLFNEPEDDFNSSDEVSDEEREDDDDDVNDENQLKTHPDELWASKLRKTIEMMESSD